MEVFSTRETERLSKSVGVIPHFDPRKYKRLSLPPMVSLIWLRFSANRLSIAFNLFYEINFLSYSWRLSAGNSPKKKEREKKKAKRHTCCLFLAATFLLLIQFLWIFSSKV